MVVICFECKTEFDTTDKRRKFCELKCYWASAKKNPNKGTFNGQPPWNKDMKGIHLSPATEFKAGQRGPNWMPISSTVIHRNKQDSPRVWIKVAEPNEWRPRAVVVWEAKNGPLPKGKLVHHIDRDSLNDRPANLQALTRAEHINEHRHEFNRTAA